MLRNVASPTMTGFAVGATPVYFTGGSGHFWAVYDAGANGFNGFTTWYCSGANRTATAVYINRNYHDGSTTYSKTNTAGHELGHQVGLGHSAYSSLMGSYNHVIPNSDDTCGVNNVYTSTSWPPTCGY